VSCQGVEYGTLGDAGALCASVVPREEAARRFKTGLTIDSVGLLPNVQRCFKCHMISSMNSGVIVIDQGAKI
jgi:hypothetical protein